MKKILFCLILFSIFVVIPSELYLRNKYKEYESFSYLYTLDSFHPFLQLKLTKEYASHVNSYGFRGEEMSLKKSENTYRIFILGGSTVLSRGNAYENTAARILEKKLQKQYPNKKIEIFNAGNDGYTSEHSLIQYLFKIKDFHTDMIILWHGFNDWYYSCSPPERAHGEYSSDYSHFYGADASMVINHFKPEPILKVKLLVYDFMLKALSDNLYSDLISSYKKNYPFEGYYLPRSKNRQYEMNDFPSLQTYKRNIQSFITLMKEDNVELVLANQPFLYSTTLDKNALSRIAFPKIHCTQQNGKYPSINSMINAMNKYNNITKSLAEENNIPFIDLASQLPKNLQYFVDDVHYTDQGNSKIADVLFKLIKQENLLEE